MNWYRFGSNTGGLRLVGAFDSACIIVVVGKWINEVLGRDSILKKKCFVRG